MQVLRRISQVVFLILFGYLFFSAAYPLTSRISVDLFLRTDPLLALSSGIAVRHLSLWMIPAALLLFAALFIGRYYCGWICPLGTILDGADRIIGKKDNRQMIHLRWIKFSILVMIIAGSFVSFQLAGFFDPISLLTRTAAVVLYPLFVLAAEGLLSLLMAIPFLTETVFRLSDALRGSVLPVYAPVFTATLTVACIFLLLLVGNLITRRFWCRHICPLGALYGFFSTRRLHKRLVNDDCIECGICAAECRMGAISSDGKTTRHAECINCMDCAAVCPAEAVYFAWYPRTEKIRYDFTRRKFLAAGAAGCVAAGLAAVAVTPPGQRGKAVRPPGAVDEQAFLDRCIRCGECIRVCSTSGRGLQYASLQTGLSGIWTPLLIPETGYCELYCVMCGEVCPTGAIRKLREEERTDIKMGTAHFDKTRCIPWYYGENCMVCEEHCPLPEKAIQFKRRRAERISGEISEVLLPFVDEALCIGCGICVNKCPVPGDRGIYLTNENETRWM